MPDDLQLKACPFCGTADAFSERADFSSSYIVCNNCLARGPTKCQSSDEEDEPGRESAIAAWNQRAPPTEAMVEAGWGEIPNSLEFTREDVRRIYTAMHKAS